MLGGRTPLEIPGEEKDGTRRLGHRDRGRNWRVDHGWLEGGRHTEYRDSLWSAPYLLGAGRGLVLGNLGLHWSCGG